MGLENGSAKEFLAHVDIKKHGDSILLDSFILSVMINDPKWSLIVNAQKNSESLFPWSFFSTQRYQTSIFFTLWRFSLLHLDLEHLKLFKTILPPPASEISADLVFKWNEARCGDPLNDEIVSWFL